MSELAKLADRLDELAERMFERGMTDEEQGLRQAAEDIRSLICEREVRDV